MRKHEVGAATGSRPMYSTPLAYLLTWTCHGTWLHGDDRGSIDDFNNRFGAPVLPPSPTLKSAKAACSARLRVY
ncbi:MAG: hypothetical protein K2Q09_11625 [Phycisphaerales bacterium]|nr:hypothetical protein [Phycisphaerales bacterium]